MAYLKPYWWIALLTPLSMIGEVLIDLIQPKLMSSIVDDGVLAGNMDHILNTGIKMLVFVIFGGLCGVASAALSGIASQNFGCDLLLAAFVVGQGEFCDEVRGVVGSDLHCQSTGGMFRGIRVQDRSIKLEMENQREKFSDQSQRIRLNNEVYRLAC